MPATSSTILCSSKHSPAVALDHLHGNRSFRVLGKLTHEGLALAEGGRIALTDLATFQEFTGTYGTVDRIDLLLKPSAPADAVERIRAGLPPGIVLERPSEFKESGSLMVRSYQLNLSVLSFVSLFVGMFLVYSLISLHATSRRHELAVLRSLGASSRLIFLLFLSEGAFFGAIGWLLAIPLGSIMVKHLLGTVSNTVSLLFVRVQVDRLLLDPSEVLLSFLTTLLVSLLAAWQPAYEAMQVAPREVFQTQEFSAGRSTRVRRLALWRPGADRPGLAPLQTTRNGRCSSRRIRGNIFSFLRVLAHFAMDPARHRPPPSAPAQTGRR